jgi:phytanoyl-CoA hydroxylase
MPSEAVNTLSYRVRRLHNSIIETACEKASGRYDPDFRTNGSLKKCDWTRSLVFCHHLWREDDYIRSIACNSQLANFVCKLASLEAVRLWHDASICKPAWGRPTAWHLDGPHWSFDSTAALTLWLALDNADQSNGCLLVLPGTHREEPVEIMGFNQEIDGLFDFYPHWAECKPFAIPCKPGDAVMFNSRLPHAAYANLTPRSRLAYTIAWMPAVARFNGKRSSMFSRYFHSLRLGDLLIDDVENPLLGPRGNAKGKDAK